MAGSSSYKMISIYKKDIEREIEKQSHSHLMEVSPEYVEIFKQYTETENKAEQVMLKRKMVKMAKQLQNEWGFKKSAANRDKLILSVLPMVMAMARRFYGSARGNISLEDLIQSGNLGACIAADKYISTPIKTGQREAKFSTVAYMWIYKYISDEAYTQATVFGGDSKKAAYDAAKLTTTMRDKITKDGEEFSNDVWDDNAMNKLMDIKEMTIASEDAAEFRKASKKLFSVLSKEEKRILFMAYGIDTPNNVVYTQVELSSKFGLSKSKVSRLIASALRKLSYTTRNNVSGQDLITALAQIHNVDLSDVPEWSIEDTY